MRPVRYSALFFDLDCTLLDYHRAEAHALERACATLELPFEAYTLESYRTLNDAIWKEFERGELSPAELRIERMRRLSAALELDIDPEHLSSVYLDSLKDTPYLVDGALELIDTLRPHCRICLLSNGFTSIQYPRIERSGLQTRADAIVISEEVGHAKPAPAIFAHAFELLGDPPKTDALMIGDNLTSDIQGGVDYGIDTCWYALERDLPDDAPEPTHVIQSLSEVVGIVGM